jgi:hypothetical protein
MLLLDAFYALGDFLVEDDIDDFPFTNVGTKSHPGYFHHGSIGLAIREMASLAGHALVGSQMASELSNKSPADELIEYYEVIAYPVPTA